MSLEKFRIPTSVHSTRIVLFIMFFTVAVKFSTPKKKKRHLGVPSYRGFPAVLLIRPTLLIGKNSINLVLEHEHRTKGPIVFLICQIGHITRNIRLNGKIVSNHLTT